MVNVLIRDLPAPVHEVLKRRAERNGQSVQQYLVAELSRWTEQPTVREWVEEVEARLERGGGDSSATAQDIVDAIDEGRNSR